MRLLLLASEGGDAQRRALHGLLASARARGDEVRMLAPDREGKLLRDAGIPIESWQPGGLFHVLRSIGALRRALDRHVPDVIHALGWAAGAVVLGALPASAAARTVVTLLDPLREGEIPKAFVERRLPELLRRAAHVTCAYETLAREVVERFGVAAEHVSVVPYGVAAALPPGAARTGDDGPIVGYAGGAEPERAWEIAFDAVASAQRTFPAAQLRIAAPGSAGTPLRAYARGRDVRYDVVAVTDAGATAFFGAIDLLIVPQGRDGLPWALLQALVDGVPVVGADRDGIGDTLRALGTGLLVDDDDAAFAQGIVHTWSAIEGARREAQGRRAAAIAAFAPAQVAARMTTIYDRIAAAATSPIPLENDD
ncbi:MAG TPA: glycosyltransferase family 4 protein [Candidatus Limnocylindria bacterium]|nr:glycosyltransferase family 4 protein [Candidatus Limnocylindria bacterium]